MKDDLQVRVGQVEVSTREQSSLVLAVEKTLTDRLEEVLSSRKIVTIFLR